MVQDAVKVGANLLVTLITSNCVFSCKLSTNRTVGRMSFIKMIIKFIQVFKWWETMLALMWPLWHIQNCTPIKHNDLIINRKRELDSVSHLPKVSQKLVMQICTYIGQRLQKYSHHLSPWSLVVQGEKSIHQIRLIGIGLGLCCSPGIFSNRPRPYKYLNLLGIKEACNPLKWWSSVM